MLIFLKAFVAMGKVNKSFLMNLMNLNCNYSIGMFHNGFVGV